MNLDDDFEELCEQVADNFWQRFGREPTHVVAAPGRVNLIGGHIDYNDGFVLPMAIPRYVVIAGGQSAVPNVHATIHSLNFQNPVKIPIQNASSPSTEGWSRYVEGVLSGFVCAGFDVPSFEAVIGANVPIGGGLSSSAALEVATATLIESMNGRSVTSKEKALLCQTAEHQFAGVPCGIMDQFSSVYGRADHLMLLDCLSQQVEYVEFRNPEVTVLITNSNVRHELSDGDYHLRRGGCETALKKLGKPSWREVTPPDIAKHARSLNEAELASARHVIGEIGRTLQTAIAIEEQNWERAGEMIFDSHDSIKNNFRASCEELDLLVDLSKQLGSSRGVFGARMTGGGFGGCMVALVKSSHVSEIINHLHTEYKNRTGIEASSFVCRPARGAHVVRNSYSHNSKIVESGDKR